MGNVHLESRQDVSFRTVLVWEAALELEGKLSRNEFDGTRPVGILLTNLSCWIKLYSKKHWKKFNGTRMVVILLNNLSWMLDKIIFRFIRDFIIYPLHALTNSFFL